MKDKLEKQLDERFTEIGFPDFDDPALPHAMRCDLACCVGQFYGGDVMVVDRRNDKLRIYTRPSPDIGLYPWGGGSGKGG